MSSNNKLRTESGVPSSFLIKVLKLLDQPGRLIFFRGSQKVGSTLDSFSAEYLLLVNEKLRDELCRVPNKFRTRPIQSLLLLPVLIPISFILGLRLFLANQIINSLLNSKKLSEMIYEEVQKSKHS